MEFRVSGLCKDFRLGGMSLFARTSVLSAVRDVSFAVPAAGSLAIVGETGSGKTTVARIIVGLEVASRGEVRVDDLVLSQRPNPGDRRRRARIMQMVFQNPGMSLTPHHPIASAIGEVVAFHQLRTEATVEARVTELLDAVGLSARLGQSRPHQLSGGQCQRAAIALALAAEPAMLVLDEPVSALDVSTQAQILNLLNDLQANLGLSLLTISHDLAMVRQIADHVVVMRKGEVVESGSVESVLAQPTNAYTQRLVDAIPDRMVGR